MVTDTGGTAAEVLADREMIVPLAPAGAVIVTVPVDELPPPTLVGFRVRPTRESGERMSVAACEVPFKVAVIATCVAAPTTVVLTTNVADEEPDATVTDDGTVAEELSLVNETTTPPDPAALVNLTVPVVLSPPITVDGLRVIAAV